ncbi:MAG: hypothetical protein QM820_53980 [Minicystis sp.]
MTIDSGALAVAGRGEAIDAKRNQFDATARAGAAAGADERRALAEAALGAIRYADPASWTTATAIAQAITAQRDAVLAAHDRVGVIVTSAEGPVEAMAAMNDAAKSGSSSPIRFPASNAGSLAGIPSIGFTFRGPTLMLTLPPDRGVPIGLLLADAWIRRGHADYVVIAATSRIDGKPAARSLLIGSPGKAEAALDRDRDGAWLAALPEAAR